MQVGELFCHNNEKDFIEANFKTELDEIVAAISIVNAAKVLTKKSDEKSKPPFLFSPTH